MNLAVLVFYFLTGGWLLSAASIVASAQSQPAQPSAASPPSSTQPQNPTPAKPATKPPRHKKKTVPDCTNSPGALNSAPTAAAASSSASEAGSSSPSSSNPASATTSDNSTSTASKPCPPPKKVVHNGGSSEPTIQLMGGTSAQQALNQRSTEELSAATEENLKKITGRQLNSDQQEIMAQIQQFMEQSKAAVAAGDPERGHNLALKARLLSEELVKP